MESNFKRKFLGLSGGLTKDGKQDNSSVVAILEKEFGFFKTSPLDSVVRFSETVGALKHVKDDSEKWSVYNKICVSGMEMDEEIWMNLALKRVPKDKELILVDDIFFNEEASLIRGFGGVIIRVVYRDMVSVFPNYEPNIVIENKSDIEILDSFRNIIFGLHSIGLYNNKNQRSV